MRKLLKPVAVLLCFGFLLMAVPNQNFAAKKQNEKFTLSLLLSQPSLLLPSILPWLNPILGSGTKDQTVKGTPSRGIVKPTGDSPIGKPGTGD